MNMPNESLASIIEESAGTKSYYMRDRTRSHPGLRKSVRKAHTLQLMQRMNQTAAKVILNLC